MANKSYHFWGFLLIYLMKYLHYQVGVHVVLVCSRRVCGPSPLHGTIVNNVQTDSSKQAFNTRVSKLIVDGATVLHLWCFCPSQHLTFNFNHLEMLFVFRDTKNATIMPSFFVIDNGSKSLCIISCLHLLCQV